MEKRNNRFSYLKGNGLPPEELTPSQEFLHKMSIYYPATEEVQDNFPTGELKQLLKNKPRRLS